MGIVDTPTLLGWKGGRLQPPYPKLAQAMAVTEQNEEEPGLDGHPASTSSFATNAKKMRFNTVIFHEYDFVLKSQLLLIN